jgi:ABC-type branched-subunit amino acid transport system ATPase component
MYSMPNWELFMLVGIPQAVLLAIAFTMTGPVFQSVIPYRLRGLGSALAAIYIFFVGATGGALLAAFLTDEFGPRVAMVAVAVPASLIGGLLILRSSSSIRQDLSLVVEELREELTEHDRQAQSPDNIPVLQVKNIDFSYGAVQVLFDVELEVRRGEILALLGTNGAGKSSVLRVVAGLATPSRGVVRLNGRTITYVSPEQRVTLGIDLLPGGKAVFPSMTVGANLEMGAYAYRKDKADRDRRIARVLELFPVLQEKLADRADSLSGGQQQMLGLARSLLHDPEILLIDELSLGLAPVVVQDLLMILDRLRSEGMTIVIVEQSLDVALSIADRAVFLEKGQVRFEGRAEDLRGRDDLVRAVFLGTGGG